MSYKLSIYCHPPHTRYNCRVRYKWRPSAEEIFGCIRKLRHRARTDGTLEVVRIKSVVLTKSETVELNNLTFTTAQDDRVL